METVAALIEISLKDYPEGMKMANVMADEKLGDHMLLSWYDRDLDLSHRSMPASVIPAVRCPVRVFLPAAGFVTSSGGYFPGISPKWLV